MADITIYGAGVSPFGRKVLTVLGEKGIAYDLEPISPLDIPAELRPHTPLGKIPFARFGDKWLADSSVICAYIERLHPTPPMYPKDNYEYARALWFEEYIDGGVQPKLGPRTFMQRVIKPLFLNQPSDESLVQQAIDEDLPPVLNYLEKEIGNRQFLVGNALSIADITVASVFVNLQHADIHVDAAKHPNLARYLKAHQSRPVMAKLIEAETHMLAAASKK